MRQRIISVSITALFCRTNSFLTSRTRLGANTIRFIAPCMLLSYSHRLATTNAEPNRTSSVRMEISNGTCLEDYKMQLTKNILGQQFWGWRMFVLESPHCRNLIWAVIGKMWDERFYGLEVFMTYQLPFLDKWVFLHIVTLCDFSKLTFCSIMQGYTGHSFNDYNHVDLTTMRDSASDNENDGKVRLKRIYSHYQYS